MLKHLKMTHLKGYIIFKNVITISVRTEQYNRWQVLLFNTHKRNEQTIPVQKVFP